jgi:integral membrane sensor domain MASE1
VTLCSPDPVILIGVVGIQLTLESTQTIAKLLPFWGPQRLLQHSIDSTVSIGAAVPVNLLYALALLLAGAYVMRRRAPSRHG